MNRPLNPALTIAGFDFEKRSSTPLPFFRRSAAAICLVVVWIGFANGVRATSTVTNCTEAALLNALQVGGQIILSCEGTITITDTIVIAKDTSLETGGHSVTITSPSRADTNNLRLFVVRPGINFTLRNVNLLNSRVNGAAGARAQKGGDAFGAALYNQGGAVNLVALTLSGHTVVAGAGGSGNDGAGGSDSEDGPSGGSGFGAAIYNEAGSLIASNVTFHSNSATGGVGGAGGNGGDGGNGGSGGWSAGAAIFNGAGATLTVMDCVFATNRVTGAGGGTGGASGGALGFPGFSGAPGEALGAAVHNRGGVVSILNSTFSQNAAIGAAGGAGSNGAIRSGHGFDGLAGGLAAGGGLVNSGGSLAITNCTFSGNALRGGAGGSGGNGSSVGFGSDGRNGGNGGNALGGALYNWSGDTTVVNSTVSGNALTPGEGGAAGEPGGNLGRAGATGSMGVAQGSACFNESGTLTVKNSILSGNRDAAVVAGNVRDAGFNLVLDPSLAAMGTGTRLNTDAQLVALADNGGPTLTLALGANSPAIDAIPTENGAPAFDQRRAARTFPYDIGAFESGGNPLGVTLSAARSGDTITLSWPVANPPFTLETQESVSSSWVAVTSAPSTANGLNQVSISATNQQRLFRLRK